MKTRQFILISIFLLVIIIELGLIYEKCYSLDYRTWKMNDTVENTFSRVDSINDSIQFNFPY